MALDGTESDDSGIVFGRELIVRKGWIVFAAVQSLGVQQGALQDFLQVGKVSRVSYPSASVLRFLSREGSWVKTFTPGIFVLPQSREVFVLLRLACEIMRLDFPRARSFG